MKSTKNIIIWCDFRNWIKLSQIYCIYKKGAIKSSQVSALDR